MSWMQTALTALSALVGGFVGGWTVAYRMGAWRQMVEGRLDVVEHRLVKGDPHVDQVPVLKARIEVVINEVQEIKRMIRDARGESVTHEECDRRHEDAES